MTNKVSPFPTRSHTDRLHDFVVSTSLVTTYAKPFDSGFIAKFDSLLKKTVYINKDYSNKTLLHHNVTMVRLTGIFKATCIFCNFALDPDVYELTFFRDKPCQ